MEYRNRTRKLSSKMAQATALGLAENIYLDTMKKLLLLTLSIVGLLAVNQSEAQTAAPTIGPAEKKITDSICNCITKVDLSKVHGKKEATQVFTDCFAGQSALLMDVAAEKGVSVTDDAAMNKLGNEIGQNLLRQNCSAILKLGVLMSGPDDDGAATDESSTAGTFKRIDNKGFNYIVITDSKGQEKSFLWLRQFADSEKLMNGTVGLVGKKITIKWHELEVYLPQAKGYFKVKEISGVSF